MKMMAPQPERRADGLSYEAVAPGLYHDEKAYELASGEYVAISVDARWMREDGGVSIKSWVRWIESDGTTKRTPTGVEVEIDIIDTSEPAFVELFGVQTLAREKLKAMLGEDPGLYSVPVEEGDDQQRPIYDPSSQVRAQIDINRAINLIRAAPGSLDVGDLMGSDVNEDIADGEG